MESFWEITQLWSCYFIQCFNTCPCQVCKCAVWDIGTTVMPLCVSWYMTRVKTAVEVILHLFNIRVDFWNVTFLVLETMKAKVLSHVWLFHGHYLATEGCVLIGFAACLPYDQPQLLVTSTYCSRREGIFEMLHNGVHAISQNSHNQPPSSCIAKLKLLSLLYPWGFNSMVAITYHGLEMISWLVDLLTESESG